MKRIMQICFPLWVLFVLRATTCFAIRISCGETTNTYATSTVWEEDQFYSASRRRKTKRIVVTGNDHEGSFFLYRKCRESSKQQQPLHYNIPAANGSYQVDLFFAETNSKRNSTGSRMFDVFIEGVLVEEKYDIFREAGEELFTATTLSTNAVVSDGELTLDFISRRFRPLICAIRALPLEEPFPTWELVSSSTRPIPRHEACFVMVQKRAYLIGGRRKRPISVWDTTRRLWYRERGPGFKMHHMQCVVDGSIIWIVSAWTGNCCVEEPLANVWGYDTLEKQWFNKTGLVESRRRGSAAAVLVGREIYLVGGNRGGHGPHAQAVPWMDSYNIDTDTWTTHLPDAKYPRDHAGGGLVGGLLCVAGGRDSGRVNFFSFSVLATECFDFGDGEWHVKENIPVGRAGSAYGTTCGGKLVVAGGEGNGIAYNTVHVFDGESWDTLRPLVTARHGTSLAVDCDSGIYIASGAGSQGGSLELDSMEVLPFTVAS